MTKDNNIPKFEALDVRGMMRLLQFSMLGMGNELRKLQDNIVLVERFGKDAVDYPTLFNPSRYNEDGIDKLLTRYNDLLQFSKNVQAMLDHVKNIDMDIFAEGVKDYFKTQNKKS